jgi:hypothetical protein
VSDVFSTFSFFKESSESMHKERREECSVWDLLS